MKNKTHNQIPKDKPSIKKIDLSITEIEKSNNLHLFQQWINDNQSLLNSSGPLAKANTNTAELMAIIKLKDEEIIRLNKSLSAVNARSANLVARRELQMLEINELNRELKYEIEVRQKTEENLKRSNEAKDRFFSIIAHDLRNPFYSIVSLLSIINDHADSFSKEEILELIRDLQSSAENTQTLLENLLEWSKTQTGRLIVESEVYKLKSIVEESTAFYKNQSNSKNIELDYKIDEDTTVFVDKNMISTVIRNLLSNAIKFSKNDGKIIISVSEENNQVKLSIADLGIGISQKDMDKLFKLDQKVTSVGTADEKGSGLGLILCKEFVEKNGGQIYVESIPGNGSTFSFTMQKAFSRQKNIQRS